MDKKRLYTDASIDVINELEIDIENFVDTIIEKYGDEYDRANLELYITEAIVTRFTYHRIKTRLGNKEKRERISSYEKI